MDTLSIVLAWKVVDNHIIIPNCLLAVLPDSRMHGIRYRTFFLLNKLCCQRCQAASCTTLTPVSSTKRHFVTKLGKKVSVSCGCNWITPYHCVHSNAEGKRRSVHQTPLVCSRNPLCGHLCDSSLATCAPVCHKLPKLTVWIKWEEAAIPKRTK